jgi:ubiquinone/menaquinone biosynthesis C-methylase UbiE
MVDASCGSGLFTRRFVKSKDYGCVVALDFSDAMLRQARTFASEEGLVDQSDDLVFVRADIARIPMTSDSVGAVHAGAAIHCWPKPREAVAEIARVLEPGAAFCGTTFLTPQLPFADDETQQRVDAAMREFQDAVAGRVGGARGFRQWNKKDLADLCGECGLVDFQCDVRGGFIFYSAKKPAPAA